MVARARRWALRTLAEGGYGFGRYFAGFCTLDDDGEPARSFGEATIDWDGSRELAPIGQD